MRSIVIGLRACFCVVLSALIVAGCSDQTSSGQGSGNDAATGLASQRMVSLSPPITETLHYLGAVDRLVGRSDYCRYPESARMLPSVGTALSPDFERIANIMPDLILSQHSNTSYRGELEQIAQTRELAWLTLQDLRSSIVTLADLTHQIDNGKALLHQLDQAFKPVQLEDSITALVILDNLFDGSTIWTIREDSIHGAVMTAAGLDNAMSALAGKQPSISLEGLLELDPELIIVLTSDPQITHATAILDGLKRLTPLRAVRSGRIAVIADENVFATGPSIMRLIERFRLVVAELLSSDQARS